MCDVQFPLIIILEHTGAVVVVIGAMLNNQSLFYHTRMV